MTVYPLDRVREYRQAARYIARAEDADMKERYLAAVELSEKTRAEQDPVTRRWSEIAVWHEVRALLGCDDDEPVAPPKPYEAAQRKLRSRGYRQCPSCLSELASDMDFDRWRRMQRDHSEAVRQHEEALG